MKPQREKARRPVHFLMYNTVLTRSQDVTHATAETTGPKNCAGRHSIVQLGDNVLGCLVGISDHEAIVNTLLRGWIFPATPRIP